jgi:hypothetical protein
MITITAQQAAELAEKHGATVQDFGDSFKFYTDDSAQAWDIEDALDDLNASNASVNS